MTMSTPNSNSWSLDARAAKVGAPSAPALPPVEGSAVLGAGCDLVHVPSFVEQCTAVGTTFTKVFSPAEIRYAHRNCNPATHTSGGPGAAGSAGVAGASATPFNAATASTVPFDAATAALWGPHLAARWAAREAFIKAWSAALLGRAPVVEDSPDLLAGISVTADQWGRPALHLSACVARAFADSCPGATPSLSLSHDGDYAMAIVILSPTPTCSH